VTGKRQHASDRRAAVDDRRFNLDVGVDGPAGGVDASNAKALHQREQRRHAPHRRRGLTGAAGAGAVDVAVLFGLLDEEALVAQRGGAFVCRDVGFIE
jgi:hypothetical protein